jgi:hypothetical protein
MASFVTTDTKLKEDFDARVPALTARITPVQEKINKSAISDADKAALAAVAAARADQGAQVDAGDAVQPNSALPGRAAVSPQDGMLYLRVASTNSSPSCKSVNADEAVREEAQVAGTKHSVWRDQPRVTVAGR